MIYHNFDQILDRVRKNPVKRKVAVAGAADRHVLEAVTEAQQMGIIDPVLIGVPADIAWLLEIMDLSGAGFEIVEANSPARCGEAAVKLIGEKKADFLMKGMIDTRDLLRPLVKKENGLHLGRTMTHVALDEIPGMSRLTALTDGGMIPYPTLEEKRDIILNAVEMLRSLGYEKPSVAVLCAVEKVNPKMPETLDAEALAAMNREGIIPDCHVVGPISYDIAMSAAIAEEKKFDCPFSGEFDILVTPSMVAGNLLNKSLIVTAGARMAGVVMGAKVPVVVTSRGSTATEKLLSLAMASLIV
ncbi:MAG: phosphate acyltransferase [Eubacteriales bacterium]|nr:phosphate acyltransferase [Eubacteriales bacterium]